MVGGCLCARKLISDVMQTESVSKLQLSVRNRVVTQWIDVEVDEFMELSESRYQTAR
jgi:hypothetical protein